MTKHTTWRGCYDGNLKDLIVPEAFAHPAKMSRLLCERIFDHGLEKGYWQPGDVILDPFGGIGTTAIIGAYRGYRIISVELEGKFHDLASQNVEMNRRNLEILGNPLPIMIQGDSRKLIELIDGGRGAITSPPYEDSLEKPHGIDPEKIKTPYGPHSQAVTPTSYGNSENQIGAFSGDTYWSAVALIYTQVFQLLPSGGAFAVVIKDFVRDKQCVPLCDQTAELLQAVGFTIPERVRAMLVKKIPQPIDMFTREAKPKIIERKSFFRRLAERKGSPRIDWEEVIWAVKP